MHMKEDAGTSNSHPPAAKKEQEEEEDAGTSNSHPPAAKKEQEEEEMRYMMYVAERMLGPPTLIHQLLKRSRRRRR
ncbi:hypothetical protein COCNU_07G004010 [Cocos nucifera]|uniref:Uncharacterized protein n=1 Tax=Cocos nucifera TaxID=13894 RepID=A0A8K0N519_COCNU|nr:hypothetical protein COCNU_07G004010 [Cocos nucifera]